MVHRASALIRPVPECIDQVYISIGAPALLGSLFLSMCSLLYLISGLLIIGFRRFDVGFDWLNRNLDIENRPLQSIGLGAGALMAMIYWAAVVVGRVVR